ncbi:MAG: hypothetical protein ABJP45_10855 [Cyclobacteriaceae bacterium]
MKKILLLITLVVQLSCSDDDNLQQKAKINEILVGGEAFLPTSGLIQDFGINSTETHYLYSFYITDGSLSSDGVGIDFGETTSFYFSFFAYSLGVDAFRTGVFEFEPARLSWPDKNFYAIGEFNGNGASKLSTGTITITGEKPNFALSFNMVLEDGRELSGNFETSFEIVKQ